MTVSRTPTRSPGGLPFAEARGCKDWLNALPLSNVAQAQAQLLEALRALPQASLEPLEELKCLELMRDKVAFVLAELRSRCAAKALPLPPADLATWQAGRALLEDIEGTYRRCLARAAQPGSPLARHAALVAQRIVRYIAAHMAWHGVVRRGVEPDLWRRLHETYARAEAAGFAAETVKDSLGSDDGVSSVAEAYLQAVLAQAAVPAELTLAQMDMVDALARLWARKVALKPAPAQGPWAVDLASATGPVPVDAAAPATLRVADTEALSRSLRRRIHGLQTGEDPATLGLPAELATPELLPALKRLHRVWCEPPAPASTAGAPDVAVAGLAFGFADIHFFVTGGKPFEQPDGSRELTRQEKQDIEVFGRISERTQTMRLSALNFQLEPWTVVAQSMGEWRLQRARGAGRGIGMARLVGMRAGESGPIFLGVVSSLHQEADGSLRATVTLFPGRPEPVPARIVQAPGGTPGRWGEAFRLPALEKARIPASLVLPAGAAARGRTVQLWEEAPRDVPLAEVLERGADFDRVSLG